MSYKKSKEAKLIKKLRKENKECQRMINAENWENAFFISLKWYMEEIKKIQANRARRLKKYG